MSNVISMPPTTPPELSECEEFPELNTIRELTLLINTHRGSRTVQNFAAALCRILKDKN
jgi:hypothetical protein